MTGYAVFAETHNNRAVLLATYRTFEEAEQHRVRLADYRRVWIEEFPPKKDVSHEPRAE